MSPSSHAQRPPLHSWPQACPLNSVSQIASTLPSDCVCRAGYYKGSVNETTGEFVCAACGVGTECTDGLIGITVETLPIEKGYWRANKMSTEVRRCR